MSQATVSQGGPGPALWTYKTMNSIPCSPHLSFGACEFPLCGFRLRPQWGFLTSQLRPAGQQLPRFCALVPWGSCFSSLSYTNGLPARGEGPRPVTLVGTGVSVHNIASHFQDDFCLRDQSFVGFRNKPQPHDAAALSSPVGQLRVPR